LLFGVAWIGSELLRFSLPDLIWKAVTRNTLFSHPAGAVRR